MLHNTSPAVYVRQHGSAVHESSSRESDARCNGMVPEVCVGGTCRAVMTTSAGPRGTSTLVPLSGVQLRAGSALGRQRRVNLYFDDDGSGLVCGVMFSAIHQTSWSWTAAYHYVPVPPSSRTMTQRSQTAASRLRRFPFVASTRSRGADSCQLLIAR